MVGFDSLKLCILLMLSRGQIWQDMRAEQSREHGETQQLHNCMNAGVCMPHTSECGLVQPHHARLTKMNRPTTQDHLTVGDEDES